MVRWFTDKEAAFPARMPLEPHEEELLQWVYQRSGENVIHGYEGHQGNWRPDLLLPAEGTEQFKLCEINSRFPFNGIDLTAWIYNALGSPETMPPFLDTATDPNRMFDGLFTLFNPDLPMYFLRGRENTVILEAFMTLVEKKTGMRPRVIHPEDLRLVPDTTLATGYALYTTNPALSTDGDERLEIIHQVGFQLFVEEYLSLRQFGHEASCFDGGTSRSARKGGRTDHNSWIKGVTAAHRLALSRQIVQRRLYPQTCTRKPWCRNTLRR